MKRVTPEQKTKINDGIAEGKTLRAIATEAGVSPGYVAQMKNGRDRAAERARRRDRQSEQAAAAPEVDRQLFLEAAANIDRQISWLEKFSERI